MKNKVSFFLNLFMFIGFNYLLFSFALWQLNPVFWSEAARVAFCFCVVLIFFSTLLIQLNDKL